MANVSKSSFGRFKLKSMEYVEKLSVLKIIAESLHKLFEMYLGNVLLTLCTHNHLRSAATNLWQAYYTKSSAPCSL